MPPKIRYSKADLLHAAFQLTREKGIDAVNARAIAGKLDCSTQPIFRAFASMKDVKAEMIRMTSELYAQYIMRCKNANEKPYLAAGMAYLAFAGDEPELFKLLFMCDRVGGDAAMNAAEDQTKDFILELVSRRTGLPRDEAERLNELIWVFTHGLATMIATRFVSLPRERMERLLTDEYLAVRGLFGLGPPENE